ncbi:hypothetical protein KKH39_04955 [Patescibacteria group bacterium]|nr:hypothetical protein [Patescibacteria group bacterium]
MKRIIAITLMLVCLAWLTGCSNMDQTTAPETSIVDQVNATNQSGGFEDVMNVASRSAEDSSTWQGIQSVLKTADPDTIILTRSRSPYGYATGYWAVMFYQKVYPSGEARGYQLPFTVTTSDVNGWTLVDSGLGAVYSTEPGYPWGYTGESNGVPFGDHVKIGGDYPTWTTRGEYAWFEVRNNTQFGTPPTFVGAWDEDNIKVRDVYNGDITDYVLID